MPKLPKRVIDGYRKLNERGGVLMRQYSSSEDAKARGGDYVFFTVRDNKKFPTKTGSLFIEEGIVKSRSDGLFEDTPQSFEACSEDEFERFKERYEQM